MSKKTKKLARERRRAEKYKRKMNNRLHYASLAGTSANKKKKSGDLNSERDLSKRHQHFFGSCGNLACVRCVGANESNTPKLAPRGSFLYGRQFM